MSSQRRFEGPVLEDLLERVRHETGEGARIVAANRVRRGGLGGFFAREHFEVVVDETEVEAPEESRSRRARRTATKTRSAKGRSATNNDNDIDSDVLIAERVDEPVRSLGSKAAASVLDLVDATNDEERHHNLVDLTRSERVPVRRRVDLDDEPVGFDDLRDVDLHDDLHDDVDDYEVAVIDDDDDAPTLVTDRPDRFHEILERLAGAVESDAELDELQRVDSRELIESIGRRGRTPEAPEVPIVPRVPSDESRATSTPGFVPLRVTRAARAIEVIERPENVLFRLGVPARFVPRGMSGTQLRGALIDSLSKLPSPALLPETNGIVIAVVGVGARPVMLARALAAEHFLDPDNVVLATETELGDGVPSWLQINDAPTAQERRRSWRRRDHTTFVAVSVPAASADSWARGVLDGLEPTQVWGIAHAAWKPEDIDGWGARLGGFDVLALENLADTVSPAAALTLDLPIGRLDGAPATPLRWADLLLDRMTQQ